MNNQELAQDWLKRANSNIIRAQRDRDIDGILPEDVAFDCQQAAEKSLKSIFVLMDIEFPHTHNIGHLIELLQAQGIDMFENISSALILTDYAVQTRYPGNYDPVSDEDLTEALQISSSIFDWAKKLIGSQ